MKQRRQPSFHGLFAGLGPEYLLQMSSGQHSIVLVDRLQNIPISGLEPHGVSYSEVIVWSRGILHRYHFSTSQGPG